MSSSTKRPRAAGSEGHRSPPLPPAPGTLFNDFMAIAAPSFPSGRPGDLACPFVRHDPEAYKQVRNACTTSGFPSTSTLKDHIRRVHLFKHGCRGCHVRFSGADSGFAHWKQKHKCSPVRKPRQKPEVGLMTEEQDERFLSLDFRTPGLKNEDAFKCVFRTLWPETRDEDIPNGIFWPGFLFSLPQIQAVLGKIEHCYMTPVLGTSGFSPQLPAPTPALPRSTPRHQSPPFNSTPFVTEYAPYAGTGVNGPGRVSDFIGSNTNEETTMRRSQATGPVLSSQNLINQVYPDQPPFEFIVPQAKNSADSGFYSGDRIETYQIYPPVPEATTYTQGAIHHNAWASEPAAFDQEAMGYNTWSFRAADSNQGAVEPDSNPSLYTLLFPTAEPTSPNFYPQFLSMEDDVDNSGP